MSMGYSLAALAPFIPIALYLPPADRGPLSPQTSEGLPAEGPNGRPWGAPESAPSQGNKGMTLLVAGVRLGALTGG